MENSSPDDDLEDQLDNFIIRKPGPQRTCYGKDSGEKIYEHIPLLVADILRSSPDPENESVYTLINPSQLKYRNCLVYGYVAGRSVYNDSFYKYIIDDGTGTMEFSIFSKPKEKRLIRCLHNEAEALVGIPGTQYEKISSSMVRLLAKSMEHIDGSTILPGSNILLWGRPNIFRNQLSLNVISFALDNDKSRKLEITFLDSLINYYQSHKTASKK